MNPKILFFIIFFYILTLFQTSFFVHFNILSSIPFIFIFVILINLFQKSENLSGLMSAVIGGFFLDIFSNSWIGFEILILLLTAIFIKLILKNYVRLTGRVSIWKNL